MTTDTTTANLGDGKRLFQRYFPTNAKAPQYARKAVKFEWSHQGLGDDHIAQLVVSELVTNSIKAPGRGKWVILRGYALSGGGVALEVWDDSPEHPTRTDTDFAEEVETGRGLFIVDELVESREVIPDPGGGKVVRVRLRTAPP